MHLPQRTEYLGSSTSFLFLKLSSLSYLCSSFLFQLSKACELILCIKSSPLLEMFRVGFVFLTGPPCSVQNATVGLTNAAKREKQNANTLIFLFLYIIFVKASLSLRLCLGLLHKVSVKTTIYFPQRIYSPNICHKSSGRI